MIRRSSVCVFVLASLAATTACQRAEPDWADTQRACLRRAGDNQAQIRAALDNAPAAHRAAMRFLVQYMPTRDLRSLRADFLLKEVALAVAVRAQTPFGGKIPDPIYFNNVLPYANVSETRESWREQFRARFLPLVKDAKSTGEAALILNKTIFGMVKVRYSTKRKRADQSPAESIEIGMASCTGLSILLADACRSVGVPARLAGIPNWANKRGNHTWVEVWDRGWHFVGAAEPSSSGLNHAWFQGDAALAKADDPKHSIYAVSYKHTGTLFPMVWAGKDRSVHAVNVTHRYTRKPTADAACRLMVCVREEPGGVRVATSVQLVDPATGEVIARGVSKGESADTNDYLTFDVTQGQKLELRWGDESALQKRPVPPLANKQRILTVHLQDGAPRAPARR